jgi:hypothetical protein
MIKERTATGNAEEIIYVNPAGIMFKNRVLVPLYSSVTPIYFEDIKGVKIYKKRIIIINVLSVIIALLLCISASVGKYTLLERIFLLIYSVSFLAIGVFYKNTKYKMTFLYKDYTYKDIAVDRFLKQDMKNLIRKINKTVSNRN